MPAKNRNKLFTEKTYYHAYNRGVEKRNVFLDDQDYRVFLSYLRSYLSDPATISMHPVSLVTGSDPVRQRPLLSFHNEIVLIAYCLMPNHFHLLIWQSETDGMTKFMRAIATSYSMYFNHRYKRVGTLFQGTYKATHVDKDEYLLHLSRYIHRNPLGLMTGSDPVKFSQYPYSSYPYYLNLKKASWINPNPILDFFSNNKGLMSHNIKLNYEGFVEEHIDDLEMLNEYTLEDD